ncbi:hypothetical protein LMG29739_03018 [Paraburkholderia solisilvae]|uniref:Uncharacterized protein n=1 Tax=Paraburkholderia solisilvae TaxID=624376 RepID=A0A6J5E1C1_9BURK|nr:hypothetical protein LMG29739_03018 [Paraburkholderia solisilvae]
MLRRTARELKLWRLVRACVACVARVTQMVLDRPSAADGALMPVTATVPLCRCAACNCGRRFVAGYSQPAFLKRHHRNMSINAITPTQIG